MLENKDFCDYETCVALYNMGLVPHPYDNTEIDKALAIISLYEAQKWLREEKGIEVVVLSIHMTGAPYYFQVYTEDYTNSDDKEYDTYEEALSEGIKEAVKILMEENNGNSL